MNDTDWRQQLGAAFGRSPEAAVDDVPAPEAEPATLLGQQGTAAVEVVLDAKGRKGKKATVIAGLLCDDRLLQELASRLKTRCSVGGSARCGEILLQGDQRVKAAELLRAEGLKVRGV